MPIKTSMKTSFGQSKEEGQILVNLYRRLFLLQVSKLTLSSIGIITSYTIDTIAVDLLWFEILLYSSDQNEAILQAVVDFQAAAENDDYANLVFELTPTFTLVGFIYAKPIVRPPVFHMFYGIPNSGALANSTIGTESQLCQVFASPEGTPVRHAGVSIAHRPSIETYRESYADYLNLSTQVARFGGSLNYGLQPFSSNAMKTASWLNGGTPLDLIPVSQNWFVGAITWADSKDDEAAMSAIEALGDAVHRAATRNGVDLPFRFMNDANHFQDVFAGYGADSYERLLAVSKIYDPDQIFQTLQNGGWLLSRSSLSKT